MVKKYRIKAGILERGHYKVDAPLQKLPCKLQQTKKQSTYTARKHLNTLGNMEGPVIGEDP